MYTLHIANKNYSSWSLRPWVLMRELAIPFEEKGYVFKGGNNWETFRTFSPSGTVPCLWDGDMRIQDSLAITEYLAEKHPGVWPEEADARTWARCAAAEMHSGFAALRTVCGMNCGVRLTLHAVPPALAKDIRRIDELWCEGVARFGGPFLAGNRFTAVDAFFAPVAFRIQTCDLALSADALAYGKRLLALPAMMAWYEQALAEPWRDADHEEEMLEYGRVREDLRTG
jgi:glutathione S-transferase